MKPLFISVATLALLFIAIAPLQAALIFPLSATASTDHGGTRSVDHAVDGSGLTGNQHTSIPDPNMWLSLGDDPAPWYKINLGGSFEVDSLQVWNYNECYFDHVNEPATNRGFQTADIWRSATGIGTSATNPSEWTLVLNDHGFTKAPGTHGYTGETVNLGGVVANYILFDDVTNFGMNNWDTPENRYGLSEVQAFGTLAPVPEPTTFIIWSLLIALGIGVGWYRRRKV